MGAKARGKSMLAATVLLATASSASAGRTDYGWLYGTDVPPEGNVELQAIVAEENHKAPSDIYDTTWWTGILVGITDQLELALPFEFLWRDSDAQASPFSSMKRWGVEARYRFVTADPEHAPALVPLLRVAVKRDIQVRDIVRAEGDAVVSYAHGRLHALVDLGFVGEYGRDSHHSELRPGAGASILVGSGVRLGAEGYSELSFDHARKSFAIVGPNFAYSKGRLWISAALGIGVYQIKWAPRLSWGVAF